MGQFTFVTDILTTCDIWIDKANKQIDMHVFSTHLSCLTSTRYVNIFHRLATHFVSLDANVVNRRNHSIKLQLLIAIGQSYGQSDGRSDTFIWNDISKKPFTQFKIKLSAILVEIGQFFIKWFRNNFPFLLTVDLTRLTNHKKSRKSIVNLLFLQQFKWMDVFKRIATLFSVEKGQSLESANYLTRWPDSSD